MARALGGASKSSGDGSKSHRTRTSPAPLPLPTSLEATAAAAAKAVAAAAAEAAAEAATSSQRGALARGAGAGENGATSSFAHAAIPPSSNCAGRIEAEENDAEEYAEQMADEFCVAMPHFVRNPLHLELFSAQARNALFFLSQLQADIPPREDHEYSFTGGGRSADEAESQLLTLVLDLDETLVHCRLDLLASPRHSLCVNFEETSMQGYVYVRPFCQLFLEIVARLFEVVVFTASSSSYADQVLDYLDPEGRLFFRRMYRQHCTETQGAYLKDVRSIGRPLSRVVLVDNSPVSTGLCPDNSIICKGWTADSCEDQELFDLLLVLQQCAGHVCSGHGTVQSFLGERYGLSELIQELRLKPELLGVF